MSDSPALFITARPKVFRGHRVAKSLSQIAELSAETRLGRVVDRPNSSLLKRQKKCTLKIFFDSPDDLIDFQRRTIFKESLEDVARHCKNKEQGIETLNL